MLKGVMLLSCGGRPDIVNIRTVRGCDTSLLCVILSPDQVAHCKTNNIGRLIEVERRLVGVKGTLLTRKSVASLIYLNHGLALMTG